MAQFFKRDQLGSIEAEPIGARELLDFFQSNVDPTDAEAILAHKELLVRYSRTANLLENIAAKALAHVGIHGDGGFYNTGQSVVIATSDYYVLRMNFWNSPSSNIVHEAREKLLLSYERPHDHNFSLLSVGCFGPGYVTNVYRYDYDAVNGRLDEPVDLAFEANYQLGVGDVIFYECNKDIHVQRIPASFSVSLNLIAQNEDQYRRSQFFFDVDSKRITGLPESRTGRILGLLDLAETAPHLFTDELREFSARTDSPVLRHRAEEILRSA